MEPRVSIITLGVRDLARAYRFYKDGLGFPTSMDPEKGEVSRAMRNRCVEISLDEGFTNCRIVSHHSIRKAHLKGDKYPNGINPKVQIGHWKSSSQPLALFSG